MESVRRDIETEVEIGGTVDKINGFLKDKGFSVRLRPSGGAGARSRRRP
ncbi:MAG: hypothetical protein HY549_10185 [Elusimicrobia bacterium]|nr:hypothetical protein [Elusimicrobiota bacterium]